MSKPLMSMEVETKRFAGFLKRYRQRQAPQNAEAAAFEVAFRILRKAILKAPVDTGRHRAGWGVAAERASIRVPDGPEDMTQDEKGAVKVTKGALIVNVTLTNGVEYSVHLEQGSSKQAPFGMVRISMREAEIELGGGGQLPQAIREFYAETWDRLGLDRGTEMRADLVRQAYGLDGS